MSFVDDPNKNSQTNVASSTPLQQGSGAAPTSEAPDSNMSTSGSQSAMIQSQGNQQPQNQNNKSGTASSGMFTNIQKYVSKNQPQAQKMSSAATQDFTKQAESIRNATQQKQQEQQTAINAGSQQMQAQTEQAKATVNAITGGQQPTVSEEQIGQFQQYLKGPNVASVGDLNLAKEQNRLGALENLSKGVGTAQGRQNLLKETFGDREYTRGQSSLDDLILSGDKAARENLIGGVQGQAQQTGQQLRDTLSQSQNALGQYRQQMGDFAGNIQDYTQGALTGVDTSVEQAYQDELARRQALLDPNSAEYQAALAGAQQRLDTLGGQVGSLTDYANYMQKQLGISGKNTDLNNYFNQMREFDKTGKLVKPLIKERTNFWGGTTYRDPFTGQEIDKDDAEKIMKSGGNITLSGSQAQNYLNKGVGSVSHYKDRQELRNAYEKLNKDILGADEQNLYGLNAYDYSGSDNSKLAKGIMDSYNFYKKQLGGLGSAEDVVQSKLGELAGGNFADLASGADINKYEVSGQAEVDKINALKKLLGQQDLVTEEQVGDNQYAAMDDILNLIKGYSGQ